MVACFACSFKFRGIKMYQLPTRLPTGWFALLYVHCVQLYPVPMFNTFS